MKVLIDSSCGRTGDGIASSLFWIPDTEVIIWLSQTKPLMDMFDETKPDIVMADWTKFSTPEMAIAAQIYPHTKLVALGDPESDNGATGLQPDLSISNYGVGGTPYIGFSGGAMIGHIGSPTPEEHLKTDLLCITDYILDLDKVMWAIDFLCENYNIKIFGTKRINIPHYLGQIDYTTKAASLASTTVYVDLDGESWYDAAWLGKQCVSISKECFNSFKDTKTLKNNVDKALGVTPEKNSAEIKLIAKNKTYFEITNEILSFFNLTEQRNQLTEKKRELIC